MREEINRLRLKVNLDNGMDGEKQLLKSKTYNRISPEASAEGLYATGAAIAGLQEEPLFSVQRLEEITLINE